LTKRQVIYGIEYFLSLKHTLNRHISRNGVIREIKLIRKKLYCDCLDDLFTGIPCRHIVASVSKDSQLNFENMNFEKRWRIDYFTDIESLKEPLLLKELNQEGEEEKIEEITMVKNF